MSAAEKTTTKPAKKRKPSPQRLKANRANAQKSTGPKTPEGKAVSSLNGLKHGMCARQPLLPGEDESAFRETYYAWVNELNPAGAVGEAYFAHAFAAYQALERGRRYEAETIARAIDDAQRSWDEARAAEVKGYVDRLPDDPAVAAEGLKKSIAGCHWMLERWQLLRDDLDDAGLWVKDQKDLALRLLGARPKDLLTDPLARAVSLPTYHLGYDEPTDVKDFVSVVEPDLHRGQIYQLRDTLMQVWLNDWPADSAEARADLTELADAEIASLTARIEELRPVEEARRAGAADAAMFADEKGVALRLRYNAANFRQMTQAIAAVKRGRAEADKQGRYEPEVSGALRGLTPPGSGPPSAAPVEANEALREFVSRPRETSYVAISATPVAAESRPSGWGRVSSALGTAGAALSGAVFGPRMAHS